MEGSGPAPPTPPQSRRHSSQFSTSTFHPGKAGSHSSTNTGANIWKQPIHGVLQNKGSFGDLLTITGSLLPSKSLWLGIGARKRENVDGSTKETKESRFQSASALELQTFKILAAERLRLIILGTRLIADYFQHTVNILKW